MFLVWKKRTLSTRGQHREGDWCAHDSKADGRVTFTPVVVSSVWAEGRSRHRTLAVVGTGIRSCCLEDAEDPIPRVSFWVNVGYRLEHLEGKAQRIDRAWLRGELAKRVPLPAERETDLYDLSFDFFMKAARSPTEQRAVQLEGALRRRTAWYKGRRPGESYDAWSRRTPGAEQRPTFERVPFGEAFRPRPSGPPPCFAALGLTWPCTEAEVKRAWRKLAAEHHPDRGGQAAAFRAARAAYDEAMAHLTRRAG